MVKASDTLTVEVAGPQNENLWFLPLDRRIRGRFDPTKIPEVSGALMRRFPAGIPGQRIGVCLSTKTGFLQEPLHAPEFNAVAAECKKVGALPPEREEFANIDLATWLHHISGAVKAGKAVIVEGTLPDRIDGEPVLSLVGRKVENPIKELAAAIRDQTAILAKVLAQRA